MKSKICLIGDSSVGKTSLIRRYVIDQFSDNYLSTIGAKVTKKELTYMYKPDKTVNLMLMIWDIMGQKEDFSSSTHRGFSYQPASIYFRDAMGAIIVADITRYETFESIRFWYHSLLKETKVQVPILFFANKVDLLDEKQWPREAVLKEFKDFNAPAFVTSAKTGENVSNGFYELGLKLIQRELG
jgi:small GTP-binding protein